MIVMQRSCYRVPFEQSKNTEGIAAAAKGRPIEQETILLTAAAIAEELRLSGPELTSEQVGFAVLEHLRELDHVAYMRFASVYKGFDDASDFQREITLLTKATEPKRHDSRA
jgi:transcriptional repressor NrdR